MASILIVDDEPSIWLFYHNVLKDGGHDVVEAQSGNEALQHVQEESLDLVVLDIKLSHQNGLNVLREITGYTPCLPVRSYRNQAETARNTCEKSTTYVAQLSDLQLQTDKSVYGFVVDLDGEVLIPESWPLEKPPSRLEQFRRERGLRQKGQKVA